MLEDMLKEPKVPLLQLVKREKLEELMYGKESIQWYGQLMTKPQTIAYFVQLNAWLLKYDIKIVL